MRVSTVDHYSEKDKICMFEIRMAPACITYTCVYVIGTYTYIPYTTYRYICIVCFHPVVFI